MPSLMFGSFSPPHYGHKFCVEAVKSMGHEPVILIPNPSSPDKPDLPSFDVRTKMIKRLIGNMPNVYIVDDIKQLNTPRVEGEHPYFTFAKLYLKQVTGKDNPFSKLQLVYGDDAATKALHKASTRFTHPQLNTLIFPRQAASSTRYLQLQENLAALSNSTATLLPPTNRFVDSISSTQVRDLIKKGDIEAAKQLTSTGVLNIIKNQKLYI
jgi:nicotinic acid mononucleotide adenylyltransferase